MIWSHTNHVFSVVHLSSWCSSNFLHLNVSKTKEICIDFHCNRTVISPIVNPTGESVEHVDSFMYLGIVLDTKLPFTEHVTAMQNKSQQRLHVLRKLQAFNIDPKLLCLYNSIIEPLIMYCSNCYYPALSMSNCTRLLKISHVTAKIIGLPTPILSQMIGHAVLKKASSISKGISLYKMQNGSLQQEFCVCGN